MSHHHDTHHDYLKIFARTFGALLVLTIVTVAVSRIDLGEANLIIAMVIASIKAGLVAMFFMHLKWEDGVVWIYVGFPIFLLFVMFGLTFIDYVTRFIP